MSDLFSKLSQLIERARAELPLAARQELATALSASTEFERTEHATRAVEASWRKTSDRAARTAAARAARDAKFLEEAGGDPVRAEHLRKAHFSRLALKSHQARRAKKAAS
ncbi:hypothetical protein [Pimelobacter simplex]|uniref:hypothetical protein n=1 Tax=Nocardioides simplex TaxID=2045 RepID=UPI003AAADFB2